MWGGAGYLPVAARSGGAMRVGLFIPCYLDQLFPQVGLAALEVLERHDVAVDFPEDQTCCGQPIANAGCSDDARPLARRMVQIFRDHSHVVCPSGSCVAMIRQHYAGLLDPVEHRQLAAPVTKNRPDRGELRSGRHK